MYIIIIIIINNNNVKKITCMNYILIIITFYCSQPRTTLSGREGSNEFCPSGGRRGLLLFIVRWMCFACLILWKRLTCQGGKVWRNDSELKRNPKCIIFQLCNDQIIMYTVLTFNSHSYGMRYWISNSIVSYTAVSASINPADVFKIPSGIPV